MRNVYELDSRGLWTGAAVQIGDEEGRPPSFVAAPEPPDLAEGELAGWTGDVWIVIQAADLVEPEPAAPPMDALRRQALDTAMAYGNAITARITGEYAEAEVLSWAQQEAEARAVVAGEELPAHAILPGMAADKGVTLRAYAESVIVNADAFRVIARAAAKLRRTATDTLTDPALDTPSKLDAAVAALKAQTDALAAELVDVAA